MSTPRTKAYSGLALFSYGFRPFFLFGAIYAAITLTFWLPEYLGNLSIPSHFTPVDWHIHELLFGFIAAIITGFLFTAVPNWTGRLPLQGPMLIALVCLWMAGRCAVAFSAVIGWPAAMIIDSCFLLTVAAVIAREIICGENYRNLKVLIPLLVLASANLLFHFEAGFGQETIFGRRMAFAAVTMMIVIIGGRIVPSFTRNWLVRENPGTLPAPFGLIDKAAIIVTAIALVGWIAAPDYIVTGIILAAAGIMQLIRLIRWRGYRTLRDALVWILHASYLLLSVGIVMLGLSILIPDIIIPAAAIHTLAIGAFGGMTLAVMVRATRGHTGLALQAGLGGKICFFAILLTVSARVMAEYMPAHYTTWLAIAAATWVISYLTYAITFSRRLTTYQKSTSS